MVNSPRFNVPFSKIKAAMDKHLTGVVRETTPTFAEAVSNFQGAYQRYGSRRAFSRATGIPESTLRRWEKSVASGKTPKTSEANQRRVTGALKKVQRVMRLTSAAENHLRNNAAVRLQAVFRGQEDRGERTLRLEDTTHDLTKFERGRNKLVTGYIAGNMNDMLDAVDDMVEAYEPDLAESYFECDAVAGFALL